MSKIFFYYRINILCTNNVHNNEYVLLVYKDLYKKYTNYIFKKKHHSHKNKTTTQQENQTKKKIVEKKLVKRINNP